MSMKFYSRLRLQISGASLAEFAVTTALMATLAATAAPKMSSLTEETKGKKTRENIDKIHSGFRVDSAYLRDEESPGNFSRGPMDGMCT